MGSTVNTLSSGTGKKNYIINGSCIIAQRGNIAAVNNVFKYGGADRFAVGPFLSSVSAGTIVSQTFNEAVSKRGQAVIGLSSTGAGTLQFYTRLEGFQVQRLNSKTITISMLVFQNTGSALTLGLQIAKATALDNFTGLTTLANPSFNIPSGSPTRISHTMTLGSSDATNGLEIRPFFTIPGALTTKDFYIGDWQLEEGSTWTPMEKKSYQEDFTECVRFYQRLQQRVVAKAVSTTEWYIIWPFNGQMRVGPVVSLTTTTPYSEDNPFQTAKIGTASTLVNHHTTIDNWAGKVTGFTGLAANTAVGFFDRDQLQADAEL